LVTSRARAVDAVTDGRVLVGGAPAMNPDRQVAADESIALTEPGPQFVSRGGMKLVAALDAFAVDPSGRRAVDIGASTGGFTDCLLQRGAAEVVAIDVGHGQLDWRLRNDPRVDVRERTNARLLEAEAFGSPASLCVADVSFISLRTLASAMLAITTDDADFVLLVKPQFEAGRDRVGKGGIVRDPEIRLAVLQEVVRGLDAEGIGVVAAIASPITGADGNVEYLVHGRRDTRSITDEALAAVVEQGP
jgi:23S rRNA (cytidine1920-2'-O)/16S rRNA (cytidine1409-2'-O)-methyltransferase